MSFSAVVSGSLISQLNCSPGNKDLFGGAGLSGNFFLPSLCLEKSALNGRSDEFHFLVTKALGWGRAVAIVTGGGPLY